MRPPMQKTALQQNEANRLQQQQQQQQLQQHQQSVHLITHNKHLQQQQLPLQTTATTLATTTATSVLTTSNNIINEFQLNVDDNTITTTSATTTDIARKSKLEQRELLVENHLNNACFAQVHHHHQQQHHQQHNHPNQQTVVTQLLQHQHQQLAPITTTARKPTTTAATPQSLPSPVYYNDFYQQHSQQQQQQPVQQRQQRPTTLVNRRRGGVGNCDDNSSSVKLLDLSTSPPAHQESGPLFRTQTTATDVLLHNRQAAYATNNSNTNASFGNSSCQQQQQRFSYTSQYSRSSSSDDSSSLSLSTACGSIGGVGGVAGFATATSGGGGGGNSGIVLTRNSSVYNTGSSFSSYNNTFDDAAENFIINFPADTTPTQPLSSHQSSSTSSSASATTTTATSGSADYYNYCLPLSETEPLLTNIEATVKDKQRSIYLNKNSASLIFTKKDLSQTIAPATPTYQQQFKLLSRTNNNFNGPSSATSVQSPSTTTAPTTATTANSVRRVPPPPFGHSTLRSFSEENYRRKPTKHLPATYHQQHRRSLQLNYNNNLVTTSTCGAIANNNHCCSAGGGGGCVGHNNSFASNNSWASVGGGGVSTHHSTTSSTNSNSAVLHKPHHNNYNYQQQQQQLPHQQKLHHQQQQLQHQQQQQQQQQHSAGYNNPSSLPNNTAAAARKQYAYSWYAPVYSALEEELEHDSRDSSPIHNLANTKKQNIHQYHHRTHDLNTSLTAAATDNELEALLETRNNINIQTHLQPVNPLKRDTISKQLNPSKLALQHSRNSSSKGSLQTAKGISLNGGGDIAAVEGFANYDLEGPHAGSLGLAGGPQPRRIRFGNFLKSLVGLRPSVTQRNAGGEPVPLAGGLGEGDSSGHGGGGGGQIPSSPEITITRTPSEQNMVVMRDPAGRQDYNVVYSSREKLANSHGDRGILAGGSTSSLNVMQQKLWNIMRREGSAISLHQEKSQSIVHYTGLRKCETVIALTRQTSSPCSPTMVGCGDGHGRGGGMTCKSQQRLSHTGSGIFSASGVEQIRPLNRLRNSVSSMNNTCSRCSSLLSLAASSSRFSLNNATGNPHHQHQHYHPHQQQYQQQHEQLTHFSQYQQHQRNPSNVSSSNISNTYSHSRDGSIEAGLHFAVKRNSRTSTNNTTNNSAAAAAAAALLGSQRNSSSTTSSRTPSLTSPTTTTTASTTIKLTTPPTENTLTLQTPLALALPAPSPASPLATTTIRREDVVYLPMESMTTTTLSAPLTVSTHLKMLTIKKEITKLEHRGNGIAEAINDEEEDDAARIARVLAGDVIDGVSNNNNFLSSSSATTMLASAPTNVTPSTSAGNAMLVVNGASAAAASASTPESVMATVLHCNAAAGIITGIPEESLLSHSTTNAINSSSAVASRPFELFTCKLCLIDVEDASNSTVLHQCGCQFCTECMKAYVEFEISEGAYEISCPDAQCPEQGVMTIPEIAMLTTNNLMKKHHRYRLNREIELDKTRTWCPRAGCETVCLIGSTISTQANAAPSTSSSAANATTMSPSSDGGGGSGGVSSSSGVGGGVGVVPSNTPLLCAVQCPSCKDEFCSACKKTWHPNITCEEHSRRLAADGQDDIGIPFDNDLIKCCPMCAVPIEKDEGCAQMMCKRCKHVFCWYCLASLDDDFLLRHYDKGPCKNKLGHSRASVVWHRAQVIGIFAGFGILLLVASPLLLLAAPCIICCKCRSCSGSKIDEGDGDMDEATALQSLN